MLSIKQKIKKIPGRFRFLFVVFFVYSIIFFFNQSLFSQGIEKTYLMMIKIVPLLLFVLLVMILMNMYIDSSKIKKHLGEDSGVRGWIYAIVLGILIAGPPYILYPMLKDLKKSGMKNSLLAVFLYNRNVKIAFVPVMIYYFGLAFTIIISVAIVVFSILNGLLIGFFVRDNVDTNSAV